MNADDRRVILLLMAMTANRRDLEHTNRSATVGVCLK